MAVRKYWGKDAAFEAACKRADTPLTHRQWRKWCQKRGKAFAHRDQKAA